MFFLLYFFLLIFGLVLLWWSGDRTIFYTQKLASAYKLDNFFLGFVLLAVATGIPELGILIQSLFKGVPSLSIADIVGSNFLNISIVIGLPVMLYGKILLSKEIYKNALFMLAASMLLMGIIFASNTLTKDLGLFFILVYAASCFYMWKMQNVRINKGQQFQDKPAHTYSTKEKLDVFFNLFFGLFLVLISSKICVNSAINIVKQTTISFDVIGATILAFGTSLPEIILNTIAIKNKQYDLAIGNTLGSTLENGSVLIGILSIFSKDPVNVASIKWIAPFFYAACLIIGSGILFRKKIGMLEGFLLLFLTITFFVFGYSVQIF